MSGDRCLEDEVLQNTMVSLISRAALTCTLFSLAHKSEELSDQHVLSILFFNFFGSISVLVFMWGIITTLPVCKLKIKPLLTLRAERVFIFLNVFLLEHCCSLPGQVMFIRGCGEHRVQQCCCAVSLQPPDTNSFSALKGTVYAKLDTSVLCRGWGGFQMWNLSE